MENELIEALRSAIKALIIQEVRLLRTEQVHPSPFVIREMKRSIHETKTRVIALVRSMDSDERNLLIKRMVDQSVEEEIDEAIEARKNKCLRYIHIRYFDETGTAHIRLPLRTGRARHIGCEKLPAPGTQCQEFIEKWSAVPIEEYLGEMSFFYEVEEMFKRFDEIWDYLTGE